MSTDLITDPRITQGIDKPDGLAHIADETETLQSAVEGTVVTTLCGYRMQQTRNPDGLPICKECIRIDQLHH